MRDAANRPRKCRAVMQITFDDMQEVAAQPQLAKDNFGLCASDAIAPSSGGEILAALHDHAQSSAA